MDKKLFLVKLPKIPDIEDDFYGIGYYSDHGFIFMLITENLIDRCPLRSIPFPKDSTYHSSNEIEVIGTIKNINKEIKNEEA